MKKIGKYFQVRTDLSRSGRQPNLELLNLLKLNKRKALYSTAELVDLTGLKKTTLRRYLEKVPVAERRLEGRQYINFYNVDDCIALASELKEFLDAGLRVMIKSD
ncbi:MAG: MerR family transcriptional regulator [Proteobacteria bacterium]|nr:MAG: MerR family transcriptional regulator [Pseudomonadota bacterium]